MKLILNTFALITLFVAANASAKTSAPYAVFNPLAMFEISTQVQQADSAFYNYGNRGYGFVVKSMPESKLPQQLASLNR